jgi:hypothetical protein
VAAVISAWIWRRLGRLLAYDSRLAGGEGERPIANTDQRTDQHHLRLRLGAWLLACVAILCQVLAVRSMWTAGVLFPVPAAHADLGYYQRVLVRLAEIQGSQRLTVEQSRLVRVMREHAVEWTAREVVATSDVSVQRDVLTMLAADVRPMRGSSEAVARRLAAESQTIDTRLAKVSDESGQLSLRQNELATTLAALSKKPEAGEAEQESEGLKGRVRAVAEELTAVESLGLELKREMRRLHGRQAWRQERAELSGGLNENYPWLQLPVVVAGGWRWWLGFWLVQLLAAGGLVGLITSRATERRQSLMSIVVGLYLIQWWLVLSA